MIALLLTLLSQNQTENLLLHDPAQNRDIPVRVSYPAGGANLPVIVFSHGARGAEDSMDPLVSNWVSNGYVVIQARHEDSAKNLSRSQILDLSKYSLSKSFASRLKDCRFLYKAIASPSTYFPDLVGKMDASRIIQGGHSYGALTSEILAGATMRGKSLAAPEPIAFFLISPRGIGSSFSEQSFSAISRPLLVITGSNDKSPIDADVSPVSRMDPYKLSPAGDKYLLWIDGASHNFGGITGTFRFKGAGIPNKQHVAWVNQITLSFFDAYAMGDGNRKQWLKNGSLTQESGGLAKLESR